jgi:AAHS family 4-hydroxybenzoate transporter-like MFS transporter
LQKEAGKPMSASDTINVTDLIDSRPITKYQASVFFLCALAALMDGYDSVIIGITAPAIAKTLGLDVKTFGPVFSAAQFGFMLGAFIAGPLADRLGRKSILIFSVSVFGLFSLLTPLSGSYEHLVALRLLTGLGLGGASATFVSLSTEYAPLRVRATIVALMWTMVPAGNVVGGLLSSVILPEHGWMLVYYIGGVVPIGIAILMIAFVPESISFLVVRGAGYAELSRIIGRVAPDLQQSPKTQYIVTEEKSGGASVAQLFSDGRALATICFWITFFCVWLVLITVLAWMVPVLREAGIPISKAPLMVAANSAGAVLGAPIIGLIMDRTNPYYVVISGCLVGAAAVSALGFAVTSVEAFAACAFLEGFTLGGASTGVIALVATSYPTAIRSTGVGWAIGVSRFGAVVGPIFAGAMLSSGWSLHHFFGSMGVLVLIATTSLTILMLKADHGRAATVLRGTTA